MYKHLLQMSGQKCYTLTQDREATMYVDEWKVLIVYPSGGEMIIPRGMIEEAIGILEQRGVLTVEQVHETITGFNGARTDRLLAVLRKLPGVTFSRAPRALYYRKPSA